MRPQAFMNDVHHAEEVNVNHCHTPLTPVTFLERSGKAFPDKTAVEHGGRVSTFGALLDRSRRLAQALLGLQVEPGDRVAVLAENNLQVVEAHFGIPAAGAVIVMLNPWLSAADIVDLLAYSGATVLVADAAAFGKVGDLCWAGTALRHVMLTGEVTTQSDSVVDYEARLRNARADVSLEALIQSEMDPIAINFTSGTTGQPKGVTYSHRAAYLHAVGQVMMAGLGTGSVYMWTLPMFHVNGWGHMWACAAVGCAQRIPRQALTSANAAEFVATIGQQRVTHLAGAPRLVRLLAETADPQQAMRGVTVVTGGAAPATVLIQRLEAMGVRLIHQYGLNETLGPFVVCEEQEQWQRLSPEERARMRARQGIPAIHAGTGVRVLDADGIDVPCDGVTLGEVAMSGNTVALGYYNNPEANRKAFRNGLFHSGDMAVVHPDGFLEIRDRIKDLIYVETEYGWENISSLEIENVLACHEAVRDAAVVGVQADGGATPVLAAFVELKEGAETRVEDLKIHCRNTLSSYKRPQVFFFAELPKTGTGKVRKDVLSKDALARLAERPRADKHIYCAWSIAS